MTGEPQIQATRWEGVSHRQIWDWVHNGPGAPAVTPAFDAVFALASELADADVDLAAAAGSAGGEWQGNAAESFLASMSGASAWAGDAQGQMHADSATATTHGSDYGHARNSVPELTDTSMHWYDYAQEAGRFVAPLTSFIATDQERREAAEQEAAETARRAMQQYEAQAQANTGSVSPLAPVPPIAVQAAAQTPSTRAGSGHVGVTTPGSDIHRPGTRSAPIRHDAAGSGAPGSTDAAGQAGTGAAAATTPGLAPGAVAGVGPVGTGTDPGGTGTLGPPGIFPGGGGEGEDERRRRPAGDEIAAIPPPIMAAPGGGDVELGSRLGPGAGAGGAGAGGAGVGGAGGAGAGAGGEGGGGPVGRGATAGTAPIAEEPAPHAAASARPSAGAGAGAGAGSIMQPATGRPGGGEDEEHSDRYYVESDELFADERRVAPPVIGA